MKPSDIMLAAPLLKAPVILGKQLRPYSAGHLLVLRFAESPYETATGKAPEVADLVYAVWVCSHTFAELQAALSEPGSFEAAALAWGDEQAAADMPAVQTAFLEYRETFCQPPKIWQNTNAAGEPIGKPLRVPEPFAIVAGIMLATRGAVRLAEAWDMSVTLALCLAAAANNLQGADNLKTDQEVAAVAAGPRLTKPPPAAESTP